MRFDGFTYIEQILQEENYKVYVDRNRSGFLEDVDTGDLTYIAGGIRSEYFASRKEHVGSIDEVFQAVLAIVSRDLPSKVPVTD